jgi:dipeptidase E
MKLILSGGGAGAQVTESYELFAKSVKGSKIMYIPLAWNNGPYESCLDWFAGEMKPFGITNIDLITDAKQITKERLSDVKGIFIGGGNTYKLIKMLKDCDAFENLREFALRDDTVVMGGSAGSLIWGKSIDTCKDDGLGLKSICDQNFVGLEDASGFDMLNGYSLLVHYKKKEEQIPKTMQRVERLLKEGYKLICLPEETSLVVENGKFSIIGSKPAEIIDSKSENLYNQEK